MIHTEKFEQIYGIMKESFPESEYREYDRQQKLLSDPRYRILTEKNEQHEIIGFLAGWEFEDFRYVENLAVRPSVRSGGIGGRLMRRFMEQSSLPIVLEVELPVDEWRQRRITFYQRLGFYLTDYRYIQPPLRVGQIGLPLNVMCYPSHLSHEKLDKITDTLFSEVYNVQKV